MVATRGMVFLANLLWTGRKKDLSAFLSPLFALASNSKLSVFLKPNFFAISTGNIISVSIVAFTFFSFFIGLLLIISVFFYSLFL